MTQLAESYFDGNDRYGTLVRMLTRGLDKYYNILAEGSMFLSPAAKESLDRVLVAFGIMARMATLPKDTLHPAP